MKLQQLYTSLCLGLAVTLSQSACSTIQKLSDSTIGRKEVRPAAVAATQKAKSREAVQAPSVARRNPDSNVPATLPPGVRTRYSSVHTDQQVVAITFDDGPHPVNTPKLLDLLKARNIKATFFVVGKNAQAYPNLIRRILEEGHEIGNHSWSHGSLPSKSDDQVRSEFQRTADAVRNASGYTMKLMRPPYGATNKHIEQMAFSEFGYSSILWSCDPQDWREPGVGEVARRLVSGTSKGGILLCHDIHAPTITAMPRVFDELIARGYRFVTVGQLLNMDTAAAPAVSAAPMAGTPSS